jgi:4-hydroxy-3-methylbut-2-enyl diphosphate reductase
MTIDQNHTPVGEEQAPPVETPGLASDMPEAALSADPSTTSSETETSQVEAPSTELPTPETPSEPRPADPAPEELPGSEPEPAPAPEPVTDPPPTIKSEATVADPGPSMVDKPPTAEPVAELEPTGEATVQPESATLEAPTLEGEAPALVEAAVEATLEPIDPAPEVTLGVSVTEAAPTELPTAPVAAPVSRPVAPTPGQGIRDSRADSDLFESYMSGDFNVDGDTNEGGYKRLTKGERIEATIIQVDRDKVFVDLGTKSEGIVPLGELSDDNLDTAKGRFNVGDKISVIVLRPEGAEGNPIVSKKRAEFEEAWDRIEEAHKTQQTIKAQVVDRVKGGLVVDVGVRGFVPATHVGSGKLRNIEKYVGQPLDLKVIEIDRERKKVVLSNRQAEEERRQSAKEEIFTSVKPGDVLDGTVRRLTDYGAFVDLGGVDGLLHISEMSWARINHPKEMFREGQKIKIMVLRLDPQAGKISLGHRQVLPDPWNLIKENYKVGQTLKVTIGRIVQSGAFIKLAEGAEAFMPVSEMSFRRIKRPQDAVEENQEVDAQIIDLRPDERRMVLSMRALGGGGDLRPSASYQPSGYEEDMRRSAGAPGGGRPVDKKKGGRKGGRGGREEFEDFEELGGRRGGFSTTGGATIGERLGMLKGFLGREDEEEPAEGEAATGEAAESAAETE